MKAIIIGTSASGKTTILRYLRSRTDHAVEEIDEKLTEKNGGTYPSDTKLKQTVLAPQIIAEVLDQDSITFFTNTDYFTVEDLKTARAKGFKVVQLEVDLEDLIARNKQRMEHEGYGDLSMYFKGMLQYQENLKNAGVVDIVLDGTMPPEALGEAILRLEA